MRDSSTRFAAALVALALCVGLAAHVHGSQRSELASLHAQSRVAPVPIVPGSLPKAHDDLRPVASSDPQQRASASGQAMPTGDLPGWHQSFHEDFAGGHLPAGWGPYAGEPGGSSAGWWSPSQVAVKDDELVLAGSWKDGTYVTGGVMSWAARATYGKYEVRLRVPRASGVKYALLLWPSHGGWPAAGEVDFAEDGDGARQGTSATLHHSSSDQQVQRSLSADFSTWQTVGVEWTPGKLVYTLKGRPWATVVSGHVPSGPMDLALQLEAGTGDQWSSVPDARTPAHTALEVDWVVGYRRA